MLTIYTPGGIDGFFRSAGHDVPTRKPKGWAITPTILGAAAAEHGQQILGPPKPPDARSSTTWWPMPMPGSWAQQDPGNAVMRLSFSNWATTEADVQRSAAAIAAACTSVDRELTA